MLANYPGQAYMEAFTIGAGAIHHTGRNLISPNWWNPDYEKYKPTNFHLFYTYTVLYCTCTVIVQWVLAWIIISFVEEFENREICKRIRQQTLKVVTNEK